MSSLLRRITPLASKTSVRRNFAKQSSGPWVASKRPFWQRETRALVGVQARSLVTSLQNQDGKDNDRQWRDRRGHQISCFPDMMTLEKYQEEKSSSHPCSVDSIRNRSLSTFTPERRSAQLWNRGAPHGFTTAVRYRHPPSSIRSSLTFSGLVATDRAATDMALRSLMTWASNYSYQMSLIPQSSSRSDFQVAFVSTNSDGSRIRDPKFARGGIRKTKIPTPPSGPNQQSMKPEDVIQEINKKSKTVIMPAIMSGMKTVLSFILNLPKHLFFYATHPSEVKASWNNMKKVIKDEIDHYWVGTKLLWADLKTARSLLRRTLRGSSLTRRERKQLLRTISDLFRLVPFSMFLIIPLMEFALPFALKIFPNLLPSTFQDSLKAEENMKRELQTRIAMTKFFQETLEELAKEQKLSASHLKQEIKESGKEDGFDESVVAEQEATAASFLDFMEKARRGEMIPNDVIVRYAHFFKDDLTLDNMPRMQLINMCKYMGIPPYGSDSFLRFQLRHRMRSLQEDDQRILWEGIDSLTKMELREACQERGMRSTGLSKDAYKRALQQWLDLSVKQNVPTSLLIMSRTFFLREEMFERGRDDGTKSIAGLADAISGLDKEVVNEVILDVATSQEKMSDPGVRKIKLEVLMKQNELIEQEQAEREEAAAKKKEQADKEKKESEKETLPDVDEPIQTDIAKDQQLDTDEISLDSNIEGSSNATKMSDVSTKDKGVKESRADDDLSAAEMDAISQLVSADPVSKERADLESIKAALQDEQQIERESDAIDATAEIVEPLGVAGDSLPPDSYTKVVASVQKDAADNILQADVATEGHAEVGSAERETRTVDDDPVVARLKKRIESMVDKIEVQLSDVQVKIGDKLHVLDKDMDGILSVEEIAEALQQVLKRKITFDEAMEIAQQMDDNKDGVFTVQELVHWIETNKLVKFVEEGRDADMDIIIEKQSAAEQENDQPEEVNNKAQRPD